MRKPTAQTKSKPDPAAEQEAQALKAELKQLQQFNQWLQGMLVFLVIVTIGSAGGAFYWLSEVQSKVDEHLPASVFELNDNLNKTRELVQQTQTEMQAQHKKLDMALAEFSDGKGQQDQERISALRDVLVQQQLDHQQTLDTLRQGMIDLANMVKGTRDWTRKYVTGVQQSKRQTKERIDELNEI